MPVPEIDRLAHEILDILRRDLVDCEIPKGPSRPVYSAFVAIDRELDEINATRKPFARCCAERLESCYLRLQELSPVGYHAPGQFQTRPRAALLGLYAALERAEMQERATPTPNLDADDPTLLAASSNALNDVSGHELGEDT